MTVHYQRLPGILLLTFRLFAQYQSLHYTLLQPQCLQISSVTKLERLPKKLLKSCFTLHQCPWRSLCHRAFCWMRNKIFFNNRWSMHFIVYFMALYWYHVFLEGNPWYQNNYILNNATKFFMDQGEAHEPSVKENSLQNSRLINFRCLGTKSGQSGVLRLESRWPTLQYSKTKLGRLRSYNFVLMTCLLWRRRWATVSHTQYMLLLTSDILYDSPKHIDKWKSYRYNKWDGRFARRFL